MRMALFCIAIGLWSIYQSFHGVVPESRTLWGKDATGQPMKSWQRFIFGFGGLLLCALGALFLVLGSSKK